MLLLNPLPEAKIFVSQLNTILTGWHKDSLTNRQYRFIALIISAMTLSAQLNWSWMRRASLGRTGVTALSWMFRCAKIRWDEVLQAAAYYLFQLYGVFEVHLVVDDSDRPRSKITKTLFGVFKTFDKKTGGFLQAQNIIFVLVVTKVFSFPIAFAFFQPDPVYSTWLRATRKLKKRGIAREDWPEELKKEPVRDHKKYPTRIELAASLLAEVQKFFAGITILVHGQPRKIRVVTISADAAYFSKVLKNTVRQLFKKTQFVSQLKKSQICWNRSGSKKTIKNYFSHHPPIEAVVRFRGGEEKKVFYCSARLFIKSQGEQVHVVALKYEGEENYRYLAAIDLTWRALDITRAYSLRWLIEVAIEDWKQYDGYGRKASQRGVDGARRGVCLSLLVDYFLLSHSIQIGLFKAGKPLCTVGSLVRSIQLENLLNNIKELIADPNLPTRLDEISEALAKSIVELRPSSKHLQGRDIGDFGPMQHLSRSEGLELEAA
jgi:hypothetical protein